MLEFVFEVVGIVRVLLCGEPRETLLVQVNAEGVETAHEYVHSHIELLVADEQRAVDVGANNCVFHVLSQRASVHHLDAATAARVGWLQNVELVLGRNTVFVHLELVEAVGQDPRVRGHVEGNWVL